MMNECDKEVAEKQGMSMPK